MAWKFYDSNGNVLQLTGSHTLDSHTGTVDSAEIASGAIDLAHMSVNSINSDQYVDRSIDTVHIGLNQVTLAEMAGGTDGNLITYDTSGDPAYVVTGTATHVLTSNGADTVPTFQAAAAGGISVAQMMAYESPPEFIADIGSNPGVAKGYARIAAVGTLQTGSYNVSSSSKEGTGFIRVVWDTDFKNTLYSTSVAVEQSSNMGTINVRGISTTHFDSQTHNNSGTTTDAAVQIISFGEQI